jgi:hypothetical protein
LIPDEDQNHETSFKDKALQAAVDSWCKIQVISSSKTGFVCKITHEICYKQRLNENIICFDE